MWQNRGKLQVNLEFSIQIWGYYRKTRVLPCGKEGMAWEGANALVSKFVLSVPKIYEQRWRTLSSAFFCEVPPSSSFFLLFASNVSQCLKVPPSSSKFLLIPSTPTNDFCVTPHKKNAYTKQLSHFDQLYKLTTLGTICAGTCLVIF